MYPHHWFDACITANTKYLLINEAGERAKIIVSNDRGHVRNSQNEENRFRRGPSRMCLAAFLRHLVTGILLDKRHVWRWHLTIFVDKYGSAIRKNTHLLPCCFSSSCSKNSIQKNRTNRVQFGRSQDSQRVWNACPSPLSWKLPCAHK